MSKQAIGWSCALALLVGLAVKGQLAAQAQDDSFDVKTIRPPAERAQQAEPGKKSAEERIESTLDQPLKTPLSFHDELLNIVLEQIAHEYDLPIVFDKAALDEVAISPESEVTISLRNISLRSALNLMLKEPGLEDLCFVVEDEVLLITTEEKANETVKTLVYRVDDLVNESTQRFNSAAQSGDYNPLIDVIVACVDHDSWNENGHGEGEIQPLSPGMLVVSQTQRVHGQIEKLLGKIRQAKGKKVNAENSTSKMATLITKGFALNMEQGENPEAIRKQLGEAIKKSVNWDAAEGSPVEKEAWLEVLPDRVLARHTPTVIKQVEIVLEDMRVHFPVQRSQNAGGAARGGGGAF